MKDKRNYVISVSVTVREKIGYSKQDAEAEVTIEHSVSGDSLTQDQLQSAIRSAMDSAARSFPTFAVAPISADIQPTE